MQADCILTNHYDASAKFCAWLEADVPMTKLKWTDDENDKIVEFYFQMLSYELRRIAYNKAKLNRQLQAIITRSHGSIERKNQNISAVLVSLGEIWINGYKPLFNFQDSLVEAVLRWFQMNPNWSPEAIQAEGAISISGIEEPSTLYFGPPPTLQNAPPLFDLERTQHVARKFNVADRDARNRALGKAGEERVVQHERASLSAAGRPDLAKKVRWVSEEDGDGLGYDIKSFQIDGRDRLVEVKTTNGWEFTPFQITRNELEVAEQSGDIWNLVRLWDFARNPRAFEIQPPLERHVALIATNFMAQFR